MPNSLIRLALIPMLGLFLLLSGQTTAADPINISNTPAWVKPLTVPERISYPQAQIQNGIFYLLLDVQVHATPSQPTATFQHYAEHIVNQNGVEENSQINISYDPAYQTLQLHSLAVIRNGKPIDKIHSAAMKILQREDEMNNLIYNGEHTLNIILDDVRVGDTIEYSYTRSGSNPVYQNIFGFSHYLNWSVPVGQLQLRVLWEKPNRLHYKLMNSALTMAEHKAPRGMEYLLTDTNVAPIQKEDSTPDWFDPWASVSFSELDNWQDVARWGLSLYDSVWVSNNELDTVVENIRNTSDSDEERISKALRFVQDEIRYLGIELGENSHKPSAAFETFQRRYGDCKDKTVLLITLLRKLGIDAHPALVNTDLSFTLADQLPGTRAFDHVITYVSHNGQQWWLDPTRTYQHGLINYVHQPDFGMALVLSPQTTGLQAMNPNNAHYGLEVTDRFVLSLDTSAPVLFSTSSVYEGWNAERQRNQLASLGQAKLQKQYLEFFQYYYPQVQVRQDFVIKDDTRENRLAITEYYNIHDFWEDKTEQRKFTASFYPNALSSYLDIPDEPSRQQPLYLTHPQHISQAIEIQFADDNWSFDNETFKEENPFFTFGFSVKFNKSAKMLKLRYEYLANTEHVPAEVYPNYVKALKKVQDYLSYGIYQNYPDNVAAAPADSETDTGTTASWWQNLDYTTILMGYVFAYLLVFILWRIEQWRRPFQGESLYYPVTLPKFIFMWIASLGLYPMYWFYRNFRYIRDQQKTAIMPVPRGIFYYLWYFNLWQSLQQDNAARFEASHLPAKSIAAVLAVLFFIAAIMMRQTLFWIPCLAVSAALCLPLANYILFINRDHPEAVHHFSRWRPRHVLLALLSAPLLVLSLGQELGFMPNSVVINGDRLWQRDIKQMQRQGIIRPGDDIQYFYSDGFLSVMEDGNGITQRHVFSYWKEDDGSLSSETANFEDIADIEVTKGNALGENTVVSIKRRDGSDFVIFLAVDEGGDKRFIKALKAHMGQAKSEP